MRVLFFSECYWPVVNGVVISIETLKKALTDDGHQVTIVVPAHPKRKAPLQEVFEIPSFPLFINPNYRGILPHFSKLRARFPPGTFDLVHCHHPFVIGRLGLKLARWAHAPCVFTHHTFYTLYAHYVPLPTSLARSVIDQMVLSFCHQVDLVLSPGQDIRRTLIQKGVRTAVQLFPTWIEPSGNAEQGRELLSLWHIPQNARKLVFAGRLAPEKNVSFLLRALVHLKKELYHLFVVGDGPSRKKLEREVKELSLENVTFTGFLPREQVLSLFHASDLFVFASESETQGLAVLEALSCGLPVVAISSSGVRDIVTDKAFLSPKDPRAMAHLIERALFSESYPLFKERAKKSASAYSRQALYPKLITWYRSLLAGSL